MIVLGNILYRRDSTLDGDNTGLANLAARPRRLTKTTKVL